MEHLANQAGFEAIKAKFQGLLPRHDEPDSPTSQASRDAPKNERTKRKK